MNSVQIFYWKFFFYLNELYLRICYIIISGLSLFCLTNLYENDLYYKFILINFTKVIKIPLILTNIGDIWTIGFIGIFKIICYLLIPYISLQIISYTSPGFYKYQNIYLINILLIINLIILFTIYITLAIIVPKFYYLILGQIININILIYQDVFKLLLLTFYFQFILILIFIISLIYSVFIIIRLYLYKIYLFEFKFLFLLISLNIIYSENAYIFSKYFIMFELFYFLVLILITREISGS